MPQFGLGERHLVIGASGGLGMELIRQLVKEEGVGVVVGTYCSADPRELFQHDKVEYVRFDLTDTAKELGVALCEAGHTEMFDGLWLMAGVCRIDVHALKPEVLEDTMKVNFHGPWRVLRARQGLVSEGGLIVVCSSAVAWCPSTYGSAYHISKRKLNEAVSSLAVRGRRYRFSLWTPGVLQTGLWNRAPLFLRGMVKLQAESSNGTSVPAAIADLIHHVHHGRRIILTTHDAKMIYRFPPAAHLVDWVVTALIEEEAVVVNHEVLPQPRAGRLARAVAARLGPYLRNQAR